jgi:hypothetical protein
MKEKKKKKKKNMKKNASHDHTKSTLENKKISTWIRADMRI